MLVKLPLLLLLFVALLCVQCSSDNSKKNSSIQIQGMHVTFPDSSQTSNTDGRLLAMAYCQSCHLFPEPALLIKSIWQKNVLPNMAMRLGVGSGTFNAYMGLSRNEIQNVLTQNVYATQPYIPMRDWEKIVAYYAAEAPETSFPQDSKAKVITSLPGFTPWIPFYNKSRPPLTTLVKYSPSNKVLYVGDRNNNLFQFNHHLQMVDSMKLSSPASDVWIENSQTAILTMGFMDPSDDYAGQLLVKTDNDKVIKTLATQLPRPVHLNIADLNHDNKQDWLISGFGNQTGRLSWFEKGKDEQLMEHVIKPVPGTLKTIAHDFNKDGKQDIIALMAQGNEQISIFFNKGNGDFEEKVVLRFSPVHGSSYFELADFNKDGAPDMVYTNGDNADLSFSLKKYHGVRVFMNDGKNNFTEKWFFPMHGAGKAIARDFDMDGDLDIAAISFFPDFADKPLESFIYFENQGKLIFQPYTSEIAQSGRWLVMDAGDVDDDGDEDVILGAFSFSPTPAPENLKKIWKNGPPFIVLRNNKY